MKRLDLANYALIVFDEALQLAYSKIVRDAAIHRFKFTLEAIWKLARRYLILQFNSSYLQ